MLPSSRNDAAGAAPVMTSSRFLEPLYGLSTRRISADFPPLSEALDEPNGLLAVGGDLRVETLLTAYRRGIFPWYSVGEPILWWSPDPRTVLIPSQIHVARSLAKRMRNGGFELCCDRDFSAVIDACAAPRKHQPGTWITKDMRSAYVALFRAGHAHSIECRVDGQLVGGLYGVAIGRVFFGESMFSRVRDASKVVMVTLCRWLGAWGYELLDCQVHSAHLASLGAREIPRARFAAHLTTLTVDSPQAQAWRVLD
jgi:leucyl/phenylalanyl-tRNA---protein transferase